MNRFLVAAFGVFSACAWGQLPPTNLGGQGDTPNTTFFFRTPPKQATQISGVESLIETGSYNRSANPGFEGGTTGWTASGGTFTTTTTAANIGSGLRSGSWNSNAAAQTLLGSNLSITSGDGFSGTEMTVSANLKCATGTCTHKMQAWNGSTVINEQDIVTDTAGFTRNTFNFIAPASGTVAIRFLSVAADEPELFIDDTYIGPAAGSVFSEDQLVSKIQTKLLTASVTTDTTVTDLTFSNLVVGKWYTARLNASFRGNSATGDANCEVQFTHNGNIIKNAQGHSDSSGQFTQATTVVTFQAAVTTLTFVTASCGTLELFGNNTARYTNATIIEHAANFQAVTDF